MKLDVVLLHNDYPSGLRTFVEEKLGGLSKFNERIVSIRAALEQQREQHRVELVAHVGGGATLVVESHGDEVHRVVGDAVSSLERSLRRKREREIDTKHAH